MARPTKDGMDYFPHDTDASNDEKIEALRALYGNDGYAFYFILLERIYRTNTAEIDVSDAETIQILAKKVAVSAEKFEQILSTALKWNCFDKKEYEKRGVLTSNGIKKRASVVVEKRVAMREKYRNNKVEVSDAETGEETRKERDKVKKSKEKKSISPAASDQKIIDALRKNIRVDIRADEVEKITCWLEDGFEPDVLIYAIEQAREYNARNIPYINKILIELHKSNILTMEEVKKRKQKRSNKEPQLPEIDEKPFNLEEYEKEALRAVGEL